MKIALIPPAGKGESSINVIFKFFGGCGRATVREGRGEWKGCVHSYKYILHMMLPTDSLPLNMIELRFHPKETQQLTSVCENDLTNMGYITLGQSIFLNNEIYDVRTLTFYYAENLGYGVCLFPYLPPMGYHVNDIEYVSIYTKSDRPSWVYFSAHSFGQGTWKLLDECETNSNGDLIVYVALNSHANYPHKGTYWRIFGFANDKCSDKGEHLIMSANNFIASYDHTFINGICLYKKLRPPPCSKSVTPWQRFFLPFYMKALRKLPAI